MTNIRFTISWLVTAALIYPLIGFLNNFYTSSIEIGLVTFSLHTLTICFLYYLLGKLKADFQVQAFQTSIACIIFISLFIFLLALINQAIQYPNIVDISLYQIEASVLVYFFISLILSLPASFCFLIWLRKKNIQQTRLYQFLNENINGLLASILLFCVYIFFCIIFNQPQYDADDIFFDADGNLYRTRFGTENYADYYYRPFHPYVLIIIRPIVFTISLFLKGDMLFAAYITNAMAGAFGIFLVWYFVKHLTKNSLYALLIATIFGASSTQLAFGSIMETYIFLSTVALIFLVLLIKDKSLPALVITGLVAFGITVSNIAQTVIAHFFIKRDIKQLIKYGLIILALIVPLSLLNNFIYPNSQPYFWEFASLAGEDKNSFPANYQRANLLGRVMVLHSIVSPNPLIIDDGFPFVKTWMFRAAIDGDPMLLATYNTTFNTFLAYFWMGLMAFGGLLFLKNFFKQDNRFFLTFILILFFNFTLHLVYGMDVFLYSANWTYALILFFALAWKEFANKHWFQIILLTFIVLLCINNAQLILTMLNTSALHIK
ncbi:MAG TPA: hypothetical protein DIW23_05240 [Anaerolineae bacterium]|nr:hypothetical protein [Anaerolineae bacterium]